MKLEEFAALLRRRKTARRALAEALRKHQTGLTRHVRERAGKRVDLLLGALEGLQKDIDRGLAEAAKEETSDSQE